MEERISSNTRKSVVAVYIYLIVKCMSTPSSPITISKIVKALEESPIEIKIDRRAVSRYVHTLADEGIGIQYKKKVGQNPGGAWYDASKIWPEFITNLSSQARW